ncbi:T9SS type B sorting domain-containing protein [Dyadobacter chenhuakuii]|uniref:Gliding motility-associated C-terminal domain-containing protein n=1 Tax=Dyadobacter chenhuakuii TaxID=2909339 RepID=A0A9X1TVC1_9BACT|nr:gliding motility-associated C-terminal domain-containing protein [Dyadobacter chenhuakuii]MCF2499912.1 gliding motility-associated C-terminal domain-containing protein [Dyadobacter chenhuakuii]
MRLILLSLFFLFILVGNTLQAQGLCDRGGGGFTMDKSEGCAPLVVRVTNTVPNPILVGYDASYDGKSPKIQNGPSFTYSLPGTYTMLQQGAVSSGQFYACQSVKVFETRVVTPQYSSCGGGKIFLSLTDDVILSAYDEVKIEWGDGKTDIWKKGSPLVIEHSYADVSSNPTALITGLYVGKGCAAGRATSLPITFQQAQLNDIAIKSVEMRGDGTLRIVYQGLSGVYTDINYSTNNSTYTSAGRRSSGGVQPFDVKNMVTTQAYQVKLSSEDLCSGKNDSRVYSSMTLSGKSEDGKNILTWSKYPDATDFTSYDLLRDGTIVKTFTSINDITYTDEDVECGSYSEYQVVAKINDVTSTSAPVGVKAEIASPKPIKDAAVTVDGDHLVTIKASVPGAGPNSTYDLTIEKAEAGATLFKKIITLFNQSEYSDPEVKTDEISYCYRISYTNSCGQKVPASQPICTILLKKNLTTLNWSTESPILAGVSGYDVIRVGSSAPEEAIPVQMNSSYTVKVNAQSDLEYNFKVRANSTQGGFESLSNVVNYKRSAGVFVPQAFSPNGDGYNDVLEAKSNQLQSFNFSVMNRWGQVVFHSNDIASGWDGTINGANAPEGSYVYKMTFVDDINQTVEKSGTFMLLR